MSWLILAVVACAIWWIYAEIADANDRIEEILHEVRHEDEPVEWGDL